MSGPALSRRAAVRSAGALTAAALVLGGCDLDPEPRSGPAAAPAPDPDRRLLLTARAELSRVIVRVSAAHGTTALVRSHQVQLRALGGTAPPITQRSRPMTAAQVTALERQTAARFTRWATTCRSGDLARVLASVAAGIRMRPETRGVA